MFSRTLLAAAACVAFLADDTGAFSLAPTARLSPVSLATSASKAPRARSGISLGAPLRMVAAEPSTTTNPLKPKARPYSIIDTLPEDYSWIVPDDGREVRERIAKYVEDGDLVETDQQILVSWLDNFREALDNAPQEDAKKFVVEDYFSVLTELIRKERKRPHYFLDESVTGTHYEPFNSHHDDTRFFDYQQFGVDVTRPLIDWDNSEVVGAENLEKIKAQLDAGENVVFCSNHQSESDTHCLFTLMEDQLGEEYGKIARNTVFIAGERVLRDAIVVPFSRGCSLLTVYSKKHIDSDPELKPAKMTHNGKTMKQLGAFFAKGGTCMWFAPSGGRDRRSEETGKVEVEKFDPNAIEMIRQVADKAGALDKTHFYAMSLATHNIFPPPASVGGALVEQRVVNYVPLRMAVSEEIPPVPVDDSLEGAELKRAIKESRVKRAELVYSMMKADYERIKGYEQ